MNFELMNWDPEMNTFSREISRLRNKMDRLFSDTNQNGNWASRDIYQYRPPCDLEETASHLLFQFDIPGVAKDDLQIDLHGNQLTVRGERCEENSEETDTRRVTECSRGYFERTFQLPVEVVADKIEANYENGVLRIAVPIAEDAKTKKIQIGEGKTSAIKKLFAKPERAKVAHHAA